MKCDTNDISEKNKYYDDHRNDLNEHRVISFLFRIRFQTKIFYIHLYTYSYFTYSSLFRIVILKFNKRRNFFRKTLFGKVSENGMDILENCISQF